MTNQIIDQTAAINLLETSNGIKFSDEQLAILEQDYSHPVLVNACAGAGKTTAFMLSALIAILTGKADPQQILGVTFSKKAQNDMEARYADYVKRLATQNVQVPVLTPTFKTFHALFYQLLRQTPKYHHINVITGYGQFTLDLLKQIRHTKSSVQSPEETLHDMFDLCNLIINSGISEDGLLDSPQHVIDALEVAGVSQINDTPYYQDYLAVIEKYQQLKTSHGLIDFNDMKVKLWHLLEDKTHREFFQHLMARYQLVFLDEFQDIDSLQWQIITVLLSDTAYKHLIAIGDDDQSIYSFRGSDPKYILNFKRWEPDEVTYNLSTNYRTGGNILNQAISVITQNHVRLAKKLLAFRQGKGTIKPYVSKYDSFDAANPILAHLTSQINNTLIDNRQIAVLVRYNSDRSLLADWLADNSCYVNISNQHAIWQNNKVYRSYVDIMRALYENRLDLLLKQASKIGFRSYLTHIRQLTRKYDFDSLYEYLEMAINSPAGSQKDARHDSLLFDCFRNVQGMIQRHDPNTLKSLFSMADELTDSYYDYMLSKNFINSDIYTEQYSYLADSIRDYTGTVSDWLTNETDKRRKLTKTIKDDDQQHVQILSLHQSKGLEFDYVYLYGLTNRTISDHTVCINSTFSPDLTLDEFKKTWQKVVTVHHDNDEKDNQDNTIKGWFNTFTKAHLDTYDLKHDKHIDQATLTVKHGVKPKAAKESEGLIVTLYRQVTGYSRMIEEERRLIYVGITRAKLECSIEVRHNHNPLLEEVPVVKAALNQKKDPATDSKKQPTKVEQEALWDTDQSNAKAE